MPRPTELVTGALKFGVCVAAISVAQAWEPGAVTTGAAAGATIGMLAQDIAKHVLGDVADNGLSAGLRMVGGPSASDFAGGRALVHVLESVQIAGIKRLLHIFEGEIKLLRPGHEREAATSFANVVRAWIKMAEKGANASTVTDGEQIARGVALLGTRLPGEQNPDTLLERCALIARDAMWARVELTMTAMKVAIPPRFKELFDGGASAGAGWWGEVQSAFAQKITADEQVRILWDSSSLARIEILSQSTHEGVQRIDATSIEVLRLLQMVADLISEMAESQTAFQTRAMTILNRLIELDPAVRTPVARV
ncbi:MAG: hypothetical protein JSR98_20030 [Proteobacteria bacterium]|nr:hypothetical protein [Pseudomonadota bacterium]